MSMTTLTGLRVPVIFLQGIEKRRNRRFREGIEQMVMQDAGIWSFGFFLYGKQPIERTHRLSGEEILWR